MFFGMIQLGVVVVIGAVTFRKMGVDDGAVRVPGKVVVMIIADLGGM